MRKKNCEAIERPLLVDTEGLKAITQMGKNTAIRIGTEAGARVQIGRSVRWNVRKIETYINSITAE